MAEDKNNSIYAPPNPYGYRININHPRINALYERYKVWRSIPHTQPMSEEERHEFESYILNGMGVS